MTRRSRPLIAALGLIALAGLAHAHGDVAPQPVNTDALPDLGADWLTGNPYRAGAAGPEVWWTAVTIGDPGYSQNRARCHGPGVVSGGLAPDLRHPEAEDYGDEWFIECFRHGHTQDGTTRMPGFEGIPDRKAAWAIRTHVETRPEDGALVAHTDRLKAICDTLAAGGGDVAALRAELDAIAAEVVTASGAERADSAPYRAALALAAAPAWARCEDHVPGPRPQNTARSFVGPTIEEIEARGVTAFAVCEDFAPSSREQGGQPRGIDIELGRSIAAALGVAPRFRFVAAGETLDADQMNRVWKGAAVGGRVSNVMLRVPQDSGYGCRVEQVVFTGQSAAGSIAVACSRAACADAVPSAADRGESAPVPAFFRLDPVGAENDSIADFCLTACPGGQIGPNIRRCPTTAAAMAALAAGQVMAVMGPQAQLEHAAAPGIAVHRPPLPSFAVGDWTLGVAIHHSHRDLAHAVDDAIAAALSDGRIEAIFHSAGLTFRPPERYRVGPTTTKVT